MTDQTVEGVMYLTVRLDPHEWRANRQLKPGKLTLRTPNVVDVDEVVVKVRVRIPLFAFRAIDGGVLDVAVLPSEAEVDQADEEPVKEIFPEGAAT